ncbi:restriction endonuclease subunit S [Acinetobacter ursingii]|uniref:restriction endonuclease subunit S n=1 Tax=Acinetobacter ursingii TaxID=108980 RepID=UPI0032B35BA3
MSVPKLRFKEFDGDWSNKKIGNIASKVGSGSTPRGGAEAYTDHGIIFIRSQNVNNDQLLLDDVAYIPEETHVKMSGSKVIANDILLNITGASIGRSCVVPHDFTEANVNQHVCIIRTPNDDPIFVQSFLSSENGQNAIQSKQAGGGREGLNFQAIRSIDFHFPPSKEEQAKIASFLSNVDEKISLLTQKHELLSQYKQGMMQKLFSQQIRFKADDGSEFGEWEDKKLGDICSHFQSGKTITSATISDNGAYPVFGGNGLRGFTDTYTHDGIFALIGRQGALCGNINLVQGENFISEHAIAVQANQESSTQWLAMWLDFMQLNRFSESSAQAGLAVNKLVKFDIKVPCLEEQTKIANFLSAIDQKIEVVAQQIEQAKTWKKGLLQQMFV